MISSGICLGAWQYLKGKYAIPIQNQINVNAAKLIVYADEYEQDFTFILSEASNALRNWMDFRQSCGEGVSGES
ncbi:hypothetical protein [Candidatus Nitrosocosmicus franklandus]|uniref:Uncharacterized protein n=1 Tax=Candidatus Nitrosocosmicus franklandianus TaxID=1798806 RepID=A0A484IGN2_9ARCH|nr:hypothetical protein [Candidatus Nitrosocosmicus franklandus]VFJ15360.1 conserved protein of unknown function [Candidatus Nitrosocosmicus franklandus]